MGLCYENAGDYEEALKAFLSTCKTSPTAETWLGAGVAFYEAQYLKTEWSIINNKSSNNYFNV